MGQPAEGHDIRLIDEDGRELPKGPDVIGEVVGRSSSMMLGYHNQAAKSREAEWFDAQGRRFIRTGDVGRFDEDGFLVLMDRRKDMIISGGFNIYPSDLEAELRQHPAVADVAVVGVASEQWGETPVAFVVRRTRPRRRARCDPTLAQRPRRQDAAPGRSAAARRTAAQRHRQGAEARTARQLSRVTDGRCTCRPAHAGLRPARYNGQNGGHAADDPVSR